MGLISGLITLPLAPVRGVSWIAEQVAEEADRQIYDESSLRRELMQLDLDHDAGLMDDEEHAQRADEILALMAQAREAPEVSPEAPEAWSEAPEVSPEAVLPEDEGPRDG